MNVFTKKLVNKNVIFFKIFVIITFLAATVSIFTDSFENTESYDIIINS